MKKRIMLMGIMLAGMVQLHAMYDRIAYSPPQRLKESDTELIRAINANDQERVIAAIKAGANVNQVTNLGEPFLNSAAQRGQNNIVKILLMAGATDTTGALLTAAWNAKFNVVKTLLQANADVYEKSSNAKTPLILAVQSYGQTELDKLHTTKVILSHLIQLTPHEKTLLKNWLLVDQRLRAEGRGLPKDLKKPLAHWIMRALAQEVQARIIKAGGMEALQNAKDQKDQKLINLLEDFLNLDNLETKILEQQTLMNLDAPPTQLTPEQKEQVNAFIQSFEAARRAQRAGVRMEDVD